ncbi:hypothetical protein OBBRIDRAFT_741238 [Obba rivulosa]|uniref:Uncharacterized protein n=1 Tax=Obba rivulosa TaxID=1052685 RepID=A0A8E2AHN4_9APHY|nr:hypothetical protein OBBRIDRAFT_741238 [Obba rivulosa]
MVNSRTYIAPGRRMSTTYRQVTSRFYGAEEPKSKPLTLLARCDGDCHYPLIESVLDDMRIQPYVHNSFIRVLHNNQIYTYLVFYRIHRRLPINRTVSLVAHSCSVRGNVVVIRTDRDGRVIGMRHGDAVVFDEIVNGLADRMDPKSFAYRKKCGPPTELMVISTPRRSQRQWRLLRDVRERQRGAARERQ